MALIAGSDIKCALRGQMRWHNCKNATKMTATVCWMRVECQITYVRVIMWQKWKKNVYGRVKMAKIGP